MRISAIDFRQGKSFITLFVSPHSFKTSQMPKFKEAVLLRLPELRFHRCDNGQGKSFVDELGDTELAHVFEHMLIEIISQMDSKVDGVRGLTTWNWKKNPRWSYCVEIEYSNPGTVALALLSALTLLDEALAECATTSSPDTEDLSPACSGALGKS